MALEAFEIYREYNALKLHFGPGKYNYFKYNGKTNVSKDAFLKSKMKYYFLKLSRKYNDIDEVRDLLVANFVKDPIVWIGTIVDESNTTYRDWLKYNQSISYNFDNETSELFSKYTPSELFRVEAGTLPKIIIEYKQGSISLETLCILCNLFSILPKWNATIDDDILYPEYRRLIENYSPFVLNRIDLVKLKDIVKKNL